HHLTHYPPPTQTYPLSLHDALPIFIDFSEDTTQAADVDRLALEFAFAHQQCQQRQDFLRTAQRERRNQNRTLAFKHALNGLSEALDFSLAGEIRRQLPVAARRFHDQ